MYYELHRLQLKSTQGKQPEKPSTTSWHTSWGIETRRGQQLTCRLFLKAPASEFTSFAYFRTLSYRTRASLHFFTNT
jgi:hypothetical protein